MRRSRHFSRMGRIHAGELDETGQESVRFVAEAAENMSTRIKALLDYSRLGRQREYAEVDCNAVMAAVHQELAHSIDAIGAELDVTPLPTVQAVRWEIEVLFRNRVGDKVAEQNFNLPSNSLHSG